MKKDWIDKKDDENPFRIRTKHSLTLSCHRNDKIANQIGKACDDDDISLFDGFDMNVVDDDDDDDSVR